MSRLHWATSLNFTGVLIAAMLAGSTGALAVDRTGERDLLLRQGRTLDLQILETQERRRDFQERQQRFREQDRLRTGEPQQRLEIPRVGRNCQVQVFGSNFLRSCR
jgi:hypothetical protein